MYFKYDIELRCINNLYVPRIYVQLNNLVTFFNCIRATLFIPYLSFRNGHVKGKFYKAFTRNIYFKL